MKKILLFAWSLFVSFSSFAQGVPWLDHYDVSWNTPGLTAAGSMPLGNGDIGLNVWVDSSGDLLFYISKTDAWGGERDTLADPWMQQGGVLMKLGLVRVSVTPRPVTRAFHQTLHLHEGEVTITEGEGAM